MRVTIITKHKLWPKSFWGPLMYYDLILITPYEVKLYMITSLSRFRNYSERWNNLSKVSQLINSSWRFEHRSVWLQISELSTHILILKRHVRGQSCWKVHFSTQAVNILDSICLSLMFLFQLLKQWGTTIMYPLYLTRLSAEDQKLYPFFLCFRTL